MAFLSASTVCAIVGFDYTDPVIGAEVDALLPLVEELIIEYIGCDPTSRTGLTFYYNGTGLQTLVLSRFLRELTSCQVIDADGNVLEDLDAVVQPIDTDQGAYRWLKLRDNALFPIGEANIKIVGDWGLATTPKGMEAAGAYILKQLFDLRKYDETVISESSNSKSTLQKSEVQLIPYLARKILDRYVNRSYMA